MPPGIEVRHSPGCSAREGGRCRCSPSYRAAVWSPRDARRIRRTFGTLAEARSWRADAQRAVNLGSLRAPSSTTVREAADAWLASARDGSITTRSGGRYKPSAIRGYEAALRRRILPEIGGARLSDVRRPDVQDLVDRLLADGLDPSTVRNAIMPLRVIYRRAIARGEVAVNPTSGLDLPAVRGRRERIASPEEAARLLAALPDDDRAVWATALYAGLRRGELAALRWEEVDLAGGVLRVERSWDVGERRPVDAKTRAGRRRVPTAAVLREHLLEHKMRQGRRDGLVFGRDAERPFDPSSLRARARTAWAATNAKRAEARGVDLEGLPAAERLEPIGLHECRHTFASLMIAAGVNAKALAAYMGHASVTITLDRYGHLMPGNEDEAAGLLDAYLARAKRAAARLAHDDRLT